ncbi:MAG TPA: hypothetical protein DEP38_04985, partial [Cyanobacteria bacterium UBA9226]|nr:hypothetical protein [Cyanobacteria bacterium UBA9226]
GYQNLVPIAGNNYNPGYGQYPNYPQSQGYQNLVPIAGNNYNPGYGQSANYPQTVIVMPGQGVGMPQGLNNYNPGIGQFPNGSQTIIVVPVPMMGIPNGFNNGFNNYNPGTIQPPYNPQSQVPLPPPVNPGSFNNYNYGIGGQLPYNPQSQVPLPPPVNSVGFNNYNYGIGGQLPYNPQSQVPLPPPVNSVGFNNYNLGRGGEFPYNSQSQVTLPNPLNANPVSFNNYNPGLIQQPNLPQNSAMISPPIQANSGGVSSYNPVGVGSGLQSNVLQSAQSSSASRTALQQRKLSQNLPQGCQSQARAASCLVPENQNGTNLIVGQAPIVPQIPTQYPNLPNPNIPNPNLPSINPTSIPISGETSPNGPFSQLRSTALRQPSLTAQGSFVTQGGSSVGRARLSGKYPLSPQAMFGATLDVTSEASGLADSPGQGININELYFATAPFADIPNLRFVLGQLDLTSYFDRNSFAKDGVTHFFNAAFQTNPALNAAGIASHPGVLVNWTLNDNIEAKAVAFSSSSKLSDFSLDGFAGEIGIRHGNAIVRGTYSTSRDGDAETSFQEAFSIDRGNGTFGLDDDDREEAYGINGEVFIPEWNMGVFARYGKYINRELDESAITYNIGVSFVDVFTKDDRLGLAYGQLLSNNQGREKPDVLELFYDFRVLRNMRLGLTWQQHNGLSETDVGVRLKTDFDVFPRN